MKKVIFITIFIFAICAVAFGQNESKTVCPNVAVTAANILVSLGEETTFTANVNVSNADKIEYQWSVDRGIIIDGQGTDTIKVKADSYDGITATVEIIGLPEGCPNHNADSTAPHCGISYYEVDAVDVLSDELTEERLNVWVAAIEDNPSAQMYIIIFNNKKFPPKKFNEKIAYIKKYLFDKNIKETNKLVILNEYKGEDKMNNKIRMFIVPQGADAPAP